MKSTLFIVFFIKQMSYDVCENEIANAIKMIWIIHENENIFLAIN